MAVLEDYLGLVTSEHRDKPKFIAMLTEYLQPIVGGIGVANSLVSLFDIDTALGIQLDIIGLWVGRTRYLTVPITGVYFTYNTGPGYHIGIYKGPFDPISGLTALPDPQYRTLLKAVIAANHWNGTIPAAYAAYAIMFEGTPFDVRILDYQDMSMAFILVGGVPDALTLALFTGGYLSLRPMGVRVRSYSYPVVDGPLFTYNVAVNDDKVAGYNLGHYAKSIAP